MFSRALDDVITIGFERTLQQDITFGMRQLVDVACKVVGVGSVGLRCFVALLLGNDEDDPLFLQLKEARASVLEPFLTKLKSGNADCFKLLRYGPAP